MEFGSAAYEHGVYAVDLARTALEAVIDTAKAKRRGHVGAQSIADRQVFEASPEKAELRIKAARPLIVNASQRLFASAADQAAPAAYCNTEALEVTTDLIRYAGRRALMSGHPLEKVLRDIYAAQSHLFVSESACFKARAGPRALLRGARPVRLPRHRSPTACLLELLGACIYPVADASESTPAPSSHSPVADAAGRASVCRAFLFRVRARFPGARTGRASWTGWRVAASRGLPHGSRRAAQLLASRESWRLWATSL
ncbi:MAG: hypothetical protein CBC48_06390 [bacterium TMED88]|nr:hypothetical protein [Deltaproteobacteria bacterium]OUV34163.1 MAG: hypothetical protein CBC48_06390 [bacterium TMED88]